MTQRRYIPQLSRGRATASNDDDWRRLAAQRDRLVAILRASRRAVSRAPVRFRSGYAASLWALATAERPPSRGRARLVLIQSS